MNPNSELTLDNILNQFEYTAICKACHQQISLKIINKLISHSFECQQINLKNNLDMEFINNIDGPQANNSQSQTDIKQTYNNNSNTIEQFIQSLLRKGRLSKGSKDLYRPTLIKLFKHLNTNVTNIQASQLNNIVKFQCKSINQLNAINRVRKSLHLGESQELNVSIKQQKKMLKESIKKRPHRSWDLKILQQVFIPQIKLLDELIKYQKGILAFRIYILFELAARISELVQITFHMVVEGLIIYTPIKQQRLGKLAERKFKISEDVICQAKKFLEVYKIPLDQTLNIGFNKQRISSKSFHKQLQYALNLILLQTKEITPEFRLLLEQFQYHDLRYMKLQEMYKNGINEKVIQQFVKHKSVKTTQNYIQNADLHEIIDLNTENISKKQKQNYKSQSLILNFDQVDLQFQSY